MAISCGRIASGVSTSGCVLPVRELRVDFSGAKDQRIADRFSLFLYPGYLFVTNGEHWNGIASVLFLC